MFGQVSQLAFWALTVVTVLGFFMAAVLFFILRKPPDHLSDEEKLEKLLSDTGYAYDERQDIFYSRMDAWQRKYGYCQLYDEATVPMSMVIDCEPVRFLYRDNRWLIEFWKGQYGITTGSEIGVYKTEKPDIVVPNVFSGTFYHSVDDEERLPMAMTLRKGQKVLFSRNEKHWWLTGFVLGEYTEPSELTMDASVTFPDDGMRIAFVNSLVRMGYSGREVRTVGNTVSLTFKKPRSRQPYSRIEQLAGLVQKKNKYLCEQYRSLAKGSGSMYERLMELQHTSPELYGLIMGMGKPEKLFKAYELLSKYLKSGR